MASTALGLAMKITASAAGMRQGTDEAAKLLNKLSTEADKSAQGFEKFSSAASGELPSAMTNLSSNLEALSQSFVDGGITQEEFRAKFKATTEEAKALTAQFEQGARMTKELRTAEERRADELERIAQLQKVGAISEQTATRARDQASGANKRAADAAGRAAAEQRKAAQIIQSTLTPMERYGQEVDELDALLKQGLLTQKQYNRAVAQSQASYDKATAGAKKFDGNAGKAVKKQTMEFNELSGILGVLPGQFGGIAARISSFASAGQGLSKLMGSGGGGLSGIVSGLGSSIAGLMNPATIAVAAFAAITVGVTALVKGLVALETRVEKTSIEAAKLGTSFQFMQQLETAATRTGESIDTLRVGFTALLRNIDAARKGGKSQIEAFQDLGITMEDLETKSPEEVFRMVGDSLNTMEDPALRTAAALKTVGENGGRLQPAFKALADAQADIIRFNAELDSFEVNNIKEMGDAFDDLSISTQGIGQALMTPFSGMMESISAGLASAFGTLSRNISTLLDAFSPLFTIIGIAVEQFLALGSIVSNIVGLAFEPFAAAGANMNEILLVMADAGRAVYTAINDFITFIRQGVRALFDFRGAGETLSGVFDKVGEVLGRIGAIFTQFGKNVAIVVGRFVERVKELVNSSPLIAGFASAIQAAFDATLSVINGFVSAFASAVDSVLSFFEWLVGVNEDIPEIEVPVATEQLEEATDVATRFYDEITDASEAAAEFGKEGFDAALRYQEQLQMIADLIAEGELTEEEGARGVEAATKEYERRLDVIESTQEAQRKAAEEAEKAAQKEIDAHNKVINSLLEEQRIRENFGGSKERADAAGNVTALAKEIEATEAKLAEARAAGDKEAIDALTLRLQKLDQLRAHEADIASGAAEASKKAEESLKKAAEAAEKAIASSTGAGPKIQEFAKEFENTLEGLKAQLQLDIISPEQFEVAAEKAREQFDKQVAAEKKIAALRDKLSEASADIEKERLASLDKRIQEPLEINDVRSAEGSSQFLDAVLGREDPAIEEYRKQLAKLEEIKEEIRKTENQPVELV